MRVGFVRNVGLGALGLAVAVLAACNDDPLSFDSDATTGIFANPTVMVVPAGRESELETRAVNEGGEPTFAPVLVNGTLIEDQQVVNAGCATVANNPLATELNPPGLFVVTGLNAVGSCTFTLSVGSVERIIDVSTVADALELSCPDVVRSGDTGTLEATLLSNDGSAIGPFDQTTDLVWESDFPNIVAVASDGAFEASEAGAATITATWSGTEATGTAGLTSRSGSCTITVGGTVPDSAAFVEADTLGSLGKYELSEEVLTFEVAVFDSVGNRTFDPAEITGITVASSDETVATATAIREELTEAEVELTVEVTMVGGGETTLSGVVETTEGDLPYEATITVVVTPTITAIEPDPAGASDVLTITGTNLAAEGLETVLTFNGFSPSDITVVSATELTVVQPLFGNGGVIDVLVNVGGATATFTYTQEGTWSAEDYEPENDDLPDAPWIGNPLNFTGSISPTDVDDLFRIVVTEEVTFDLTMDWTDAGVDADIAVVNEAFTAYVCSDGATGAKPENTECALAAGTYFLWINFYDGPGATDYTVTSN